MNTKTEEKLLGIWREVLNNEDIGYEDNFFDVGGNSLYAMMLLNRIEDDFDVEVTVADLFECVNVREVAQVIDKYKADSEAV